MTVNQLIEKLQHLQPALREKDVVIITPNGIQTEPEIKMLLEDEFNIFGGVDNIKAMLLTY